MRIFGLLVLAAGLVVTTGCQFDINLSDAGVGSGVQGSGNSKTEVRELEDEFSSIQMNGNGTLEVRQGEKTQVTVTGDDNLLELISTRVEDGKLVIEPTESISTSNGLTFAVVAAKVESIVVDGAGSSELIDFEGTKLKLTINGAGNFTGSGTVDSLELEINGAGSAKLSSLKSKSANIVLSGAGNATVFASEASDSEINGVGSVVVYGKPTSKKKSVNGIGSVKYVD